VDLLCIVAEPTPVGTLTARRIHALARKLPIVVKSLGVLWNRTDSDVPVAEGLESLEVLACVPEDARVLEASRHGANVFALASDNPALQAVRGMVEQRFPAPQTKVAATR
jgi:CO dehydrogenase nickel-insertion accessory protein CooC1